jgi:hypothetical protein
MNFGFGPQTPTPSSPRPRTVYDAHPARPPLPHISEYPAANACPLHLHFFGDGYRKSCRDPKNGVALAEAPPPSCSIRAACYPPKGCARGWQLAAPESFKFKGASLGNEVGAHNFPKLCPLRGCCRKPIPLRHPLRPPPSSPRPSSLFSCVCVCGVCVQCDVMHVSMRACMAHGSMCVCPHVPLVTGRVAHSPNRPALAVLVVSLSCLLYT